MTIAFQLAVFALIATSSVLLISVPLVFASSDGWSSNKNVLFSHIVRSEVVVVTDTFLLTSLTITQAEL